MEQFRSRSDDFMSEKTCRITPNLFDEVPEMGYVETMLSENNIPFVWKDSLHTLHKKQNKKDWLGLTFNDWEKIMRK
jgi:hypothetical protein